MSIDNLQNLIGMTVLAGDTEIGIKGFQSDSAFVALAAAGLLQNPVISETAPTAPVPVKGDFWLDKSGAAATNPPTAPGVWMRHNGTAFVAATPLADAADVGSTTALDIQGNWDASTNTPALADGVGTQGFAYIVSVAGTTSIDGENDWNPQDIAYFANGTWHKIDNTDAGNTPLVQATL